MAATLFIGISYRQDFEPTDLTNGGKPAKLRLVQGWEREYAPHVFSYAPPSPDITGRWAYPTGQSF